MTTHTKKALLSYSFMIMFAVSIWLGLNACHYVGVARAQATGAGVDPAADATSTIVDFLTSGQYLPAIGAMMVALVGTVRLFLTKWTRTMTFAKSQLGGYAIAYSVSMIVYVGTALEQSQSVNLKLLLMAATAALTASGLLDHWRDILDATKKVPNGTATMLVLMIGVSTLACSGCHEVTSSKPANAVVECVKENQAQILSLAGQCETKAPDWTAVEACVVTAAPQLGYKIGGCVLGKLVNDYLSKKGVALDVPQSKAANKALEDYRKTYLDGATIRLPEGDL